VKECAASAQWCSAPVAGAFIAVPTPARGDTAWNAGCLGHPQECCPRGRWLLVRISISSLFSKCTKLKNGAFPITPPPPWSSLFIKGRKP
jgi:hypothetical protein